VFVCVCLPVCLSVCRWLTNRSDWRGSEVVCLFLSLSLSLSFSLSLFVPFSLFPTVCVSISVCLSVCLSVSQSVSHLVCLAVCVSVCLLVSLSTCLPVCLVGQSDQFEISLKAIFCSAHLHVVCKVRDVFRDVLHVRNDISTIQTLSLTRESLT